MHFAYRLCVLVSSTYPNTSNRIRQKILLLLALYTRAFFPARNKSLRYSRARVSPTIYVIAMRSRRVSQLKPRSDAHHASDHA